MDIATLLGLLLGFGLVGGAIASGGSMGAFIDVPSILIVICGTFAITMVSYTLPEMIKAQGLYMKTLFFKMADPIESCKQLLEMAQKARANGLLAIQEDVDKLDDEFLKSSLTQAVDGANPEVVEGLMKADTANMVDRHEKGYGILLKAAEVAPAMGLIGTLIGLVQMLGNLSDPSAIGPAMAVALLTTMYGAVIANMVFMPLAGKLELNSQKEYLVRKIYMTGVLSIVRQENPRQLEVMLNTLLPPAQRIQFFD